MATTTHPEFHQDTEAKQVPVAFAGSISGETILATGVNPKSLGFSVAEGFVSLVLS